MAAHIFGDGEGAIWTTAVWSDTRCSIVGGGGGAVREDMDR